MKLSLIICFSILAINTSVFADTVYQGKFRGLGMTYSTKNIYTFIATQNNFHLGVFGKNWELSENDINGSESEYPRTKIGEEEEIYGADLGWSWPVNKYIRYGFVISGGMEKLYGRYRDENRKDSYYKRIETQYIGGTGVILGISPHPNIEIFTSANTYKGLSAGLLIRY